MSIAEMRTVPMIAADANPDGENEAFMGNWAFSVVPQKARDYGIAEADTQMWIKEQTQLCKEGAFFACLHRFLFLAYKPGA